MPALIPVALGLLSLVGTPAAPSGREGQLIGFGLVVGLDGTGSRSTFTQQVVEDVKRRVTGTPVGRMRGIADRWTKERLGPCARPRQETSPEGIWRSANCSVVFVSATIPAGANEGDKLDLTVSPMDDATSLRGGVLLLTPLKGADGQVYAVGQGALGVRPDDDPARTATVWNGGLVETPVVNGSGFTPPRVRGTRGGTR